MNLVSSKEEMMNVNKLQSHLLDLKRSLLNEKHNNFDDLEKKVYEIKRYTQLNRNVDIDDLIIHCIYCNKNVKYNRCMKQHMRTKTHLKNKSIYINNNVNVNKCNPENVLKFDE